MKKLFLAAAFITSAFLSNAQSELTELSSKKDFGKNIVAFNPVHLIASDFVGVGFSYERLVNEYLGVKVPLMIAINNNYFNVGIEAKLYPAKNNGAVRYAVAPMLMAGMGERRRNETIYNGNGVYVRDTTIERASHVGFLLNQTLNITIAKQFYIGLDGGIGINYYDEAADNDNNISFAAQLQIGLGYRF